MTDRSLRLWPALASLAAALMLATAHAFQTFGGYEPCELCLRQREVYWLAVGLGLPLAFAVRARPALLRPAVLLLGLVFLAEAVLAAYHSGVEWRFWPGPSSCTAPAAHGVSVSDMNDLLKGRPTRVVLCDRAPFRFMGLSMAGWNALAALALTGASVFVASTSRSSS